MSREETLLKGVFPGFFCLRKEKGKDAFYKNGDFERLSEIEGVRMRTGFLLPRRSPPEHGAAFQTQNSPLQNPALFRILIATSQGKAFSRIPEAFGSRWKLSGSAGPAAGSWKKTPAHKDKKQKQGAKHKTQGTRSKV